MPSIDFETEKTTFRDFYNENIKTLEGAANSFKSLISALINHNTGLCISKIQSRVKDREESIRKFNIKYRKKLETEKTPYRISDHISDLIGLRIVCLYEDDIEIIKAILVKEFELIDETNKINQMESTEDSFGYKGLHLDLKICAKRREMPEYQSFKNFPFEVQLRTIIQDSWSELDHKIKYKKSIPSSLKRRINTLAALFELADREFKEIRIATFEELQKTDNQEPEQNTALNEDQAGPPTPIKTGSKLTAFGFLKIAKHYFNNFEFEDYKVDGFTNEIVSIDSNMTKLYLNECLRQNISTVKAYKTDFEKHSGDKEMLNPFTVIRHCLYLSDKVKFTSILTNISKESFENWLSSPNTSAANQ